MSKISIILCTVIGLLVINTIRLYHKVKGLDEQIATALNNAEAWQSIANDNQSEARTLQLSINEFKQSNDSLIQVSSELQEQLKIKDKELRQVAAIETVIRDTTVVSVPTSTDFSVELKPNQLTTITVSRVDSILTHTMEILNHQDLFVYENKVYRKQYKNWFQRLIHFDFKKDKINKYQIINSNNLIQVTDTRVITISD